MMPRGREGWPAAVLRSGMARDDFDELEDLGSGVAIQRLTLDGAFRALAFFHPCADGDHQSYVPLGTNLGWTLVSEDPLTLSPSLLCPICGHHGFVREGRWVPA
jgi:hypothetical protein